MQKKIIFIPGKNPKPKSTEHTALLKRCLIEGVNRVSKHAAHEIIEQDAFSLSAWNYDFYGKFMDFEARFGSLDPLFRKLRPSMKDKLYARTWKMKAFSAMYNTGDQLPWLIDLIADDHIKALINDSLTYFDDIDSKATEARRKLKEDLRGAGEKYKILLIGHSMGSIIAYDSLYEMSQADRSKKHIDLFLTLGSPLGLRYTQKRLLAYSEKDPERLPSNIVDWKNVAAKGDLVSFDRTLADDFRAMKKHNLVENIQDYNRDVYHWHKDNKGYNFHSSYGYLVGSHVSKIITNWWEQN